MRWWSTEHSLTELRYKEFCLQLRNIRNDLRDLKNIYVSCQPAHVLLGRIFFINHQKAEVSFNMWLGLQPRSDFGLTLCCVCISKSGTPGCVIQARNLLLCTQSFADLA